MINYFDAIVYPSDLALLDSKSEWLNDAVINFQMTRLQQTQKQDTLPKANDDQRGQKRQREDSIEQLEDLFLDPSVVSFLMHQLTEDDEDYEDELSNLCASSWNLPQLANAPQGKRIFVPISDQFGASRLAFTRPGGGNHWSMLLWEVNTLLCKTNESIVAVEQAFYHFDSSSGLNKMACQAVAKKLQKVLGTSLPKEVMSKDVEVFECNAPQQQNGYDCGVLALGNAEALSTCHSGSTRKEYEAAVQTHFKKNGGHGTFALSLRKQIGGDIRQLAGK